MANLTILIGFLSQAKISKLDEKYQMNIRPDKYTKFDLNNDFLCTVDLKRENEIKIKLGTITSVPGLNDDEKDDLLMEIHVCRRRIRLSQKYVSSQMEEDICNMVYYMVIGIKTLQLLKEWKDFVNDMAWKVHEQKSYSTWFHTNFDVFENYLPNNANDFPDFYRDSAIVLYAVFQKYIRIRKTELSNEINHY